MLTTQARVAMHNNQPVKLVGDLYHIIDIKRGGRIMINELQEKLTKLNSHLSCELITKDETKAELNGDFLELQQQEAGDVIVKYADEPVLIMSKVEDTPVIKLEVTYTDKRNSKLFANLIELCGNYLPDSKEEE